MNFLLTEIKSKGITLLCIILATLLTVSYISGNSNRTALDETRSKLSYHVELNKRLSDENLNFAKELNKQPEEYIKVVKEVVNETCNGEVKQQLIESIATQREQKINETNTADIDDRLPTILIQLLK